MKKTPFQVNYLYCILQELEHALLPIRICYCTVDVEKGHAGAQVKSES